MRIFVRFQHLCHGRRTLQQVLRRHVSAVVHAARLALHLCILALPSSRTTALVANAPECPSVCHLAGCMCCTSVLHVCAASMRRCNRVRPNTSVVLQPIQYIRHATANVVHLPARRTRPLLSTQIPVPPPLPCTPLSAPASLWVCGGGIIASTNPSIYLTRQQRNHLCSFLNVFFLL